MNNFKEVDYLARILYLNCVNTFLFWRFFMQVIFYGNFDSDELNVLQPFTDLVSNELLFKCNSIESVVSSLKNQLVSESVLVLKVNTIVELTNFELMGYLLRGTKVFLLIPFNSAEFVKKALRLRPRLIAENTEDLEIMTKVLIKYYEKNNGENL